MREMFERQKIESERIRNLLLKKMQAGETPPLSEVGMLMLGLIDICRQMVYTQEEQDRTARDTKTELREQIKENYAEIVEHIEEDRKKWINPRAQSFINKLVSVLVCILMSGAGYLWARVETLTLAVAEHSRSIAVIERVVENVESSLRVVENDLKQHK